MCNTIIVTRCQSAFEQRCNNTSVIQFMTAVPQGLEPQTSALKEAAELSPVNRQDRHIGARQSTRQSQEDNRAIWLSVRLQAHPLVFGKGTAR
ncbi:hypothetical protein NEUTE1DRAFT_118324 [Neurospora tetrasperma FGSC 2508]|uniref:Uncharacterized protein n=1 Tax=Neurospora tetrasperma (strain FGSC 2508 / ATCC MYA-4615 / P0657) TaxID=510951 RepID=F8MVQ4_NEUT8|nr:uncharacterized protein NEUTE1DRAFT_118324 [Neurospora tetrasperma FGSC 2508]EGO54805.1 hypothetical protein NEUTE1DRAFT_118324 [Neurospora tetrasperma FGSC 2508]EGZ67710.1 hypothetical protein NEUTE2DRAFT_145709 [Neurospora tetrasperma FGSC 2509]